MTSLWEIADDTSYIREKVNHISDQLKLLHQQSSSSSPDSTVPLQNQILRLIENEIASQMKLQESQQEHILIAEDRERQELMKQKLLDYDSEKQNEKTLTIMTIDGKKISSGMRIY